MTRSKSPLRSILAFSLSLPLLVASLLAGSLSPTERRIVDAARASSPEALALLERVVNINSGTMNLTGVAQVGRLFRAELDRLGFTTRWIPMQEVKRAGHLFAEHDGEGPRLLLIGHLDTVFEKESPFQHFERHGNRAAGPGVEDMKGGDVVMLFALKALQAAGALKKTNLTVALMGDEEDTGDPLTVSRRDLVAAARRSQFALGFEGVAGALDTATVARRGFTGWEVRVEARPGHSSQIFKESFGAGAIYEASRILSDFYRELRGEKYLTFNPGLILGGTSLSFDAAHSRGQAFGKTNVIAQTAVVSGDLRFISKEQRGRAKRRMREIVSRHLPQTSAEITFQDSYPAMSPSEANYKLLGRLDRVSRDLGLGPVRAVDPGERGAADVSFAAPYVEASLDGLGVLGSGGHTVREEVDLESLPLLIQRSALLIYRLTR